MSARRRILLVEDSEAVRAAFTILLEESGYDVAAAGTSDEALRLALELVPDLVLLDLGLPGVGGLEVARRIKSSPATGDVTVVALTGRDTDADRAACIAAGCTAYLVKPVDTRALLRDIPGWLRADSLPPNPSPS